MVTHGTVQTGESARWGNAVIHDTVQTGVSACWGNEATHGTEQTVVSACQGNAVTGISGHEQIHKPLRLQIMLILMLKKYVNGRYHTLRASCNDVKCDRCTVGMD